MVTKAHFGEGHVTALTPAARYVARLEDGAYAEIVRRLNELMARDKLSARELSRRSHVAVNSVSGAMKGETRPRLGNLLALAHGLGVTLDQLLGEGPIGRLVERAEPPTDEAEQQSA